MYIFISQASCIKPWYYFVPFYRENLETKQKHNPQLMDSMFFINEKLIDK